MSRDPKIDTPSKKRRLDSEIDSDVVTDEIPLKKQKNKELDLISYTESWTGDKDTNEDRYLNIHLENFGSYYGLYDGHGGTACADYVTTHLHKNIYNCLKKKGLIKDKNIYNNFEEDEKEKQLQTIETQIQTFLSEKQELLRLIADGGVDGASFQSVIDQLDSSIDQLNLVLKELKLRQTESRLHEAEEPYSFPSQKDLEDVFIEAYATTDAQFLSLIQKRKKANVSGGGSTALSLILLGNKETELKLAVANLGDCRAILGSQTKFKRLTSDHKPNRPDEKKRIEQAGGFVGNVRGIWRVCSRAGVGMYVDKPQVTTFLSVSRAFGDEDLKQPSPVISCRPEVSLIDLHEEDLFVIIGCDGIWDVLDDQTAVELVRKNFKDAKMAATELVRNAYRKGSQDNLTVTVVFFGWKSSLGEEFKQKEEMKHVEEGDIDMFS